jgi:hypothetical protein
LNKGNNRISINSSSNNYNGYIVNSNYRNYNDNTFNTWSGNSNSTGNRVDTGSLQELLDLIEMLKFGSLKLMIGLRRKVLLPMKINLVT